MRLRLLVISALHLISIAASSTGNAGRSTVYTSQDLQSELPLCAEECLDLPNCSSNDLDCFCTDAALLTVETCAQSNCTVRQFLVAKDTHRSACGIPERNYSYMLSRSMWTLYALAVLAVLFRFLARSQMMGGVGFGGDDWVMLASLAPLTLYVGVLGHGTTKGLGKDIWTLQPAQIDSILRNLWISIFAYTAVLAGVQVSVIMFYMRIFGDAHPRFRMLCMVIIGACLSTGVAAWIGSLFFCSSIPLFWHLWDGEHAGNCRTAHAQIYATAGINIFLDLVILALPIPKLHDLNVSMARKVGLGATFLVGLVTTCASIVRLRYLITWGDTMNPTWDYNDTAIASTYECHLSIICACMPSMAGLWKRFCRRRKVSELHSQRTRSTHHQASTSKEILFQKPEPVHGRPRTKSSVRVTVSLAEFLAIEEGSNATELELTQRGIDHANEEIARIKALV